MTKRHSTSLVALMIGTLLTLGCASIPAVAAGDTSAVFTLPSGVQVEIVESAFKKTLFSIAGCAGQGGPCKINGAVPFGSDFTVPTTYVKKITVLYKGRSHSLDASNMYNAWGARPLETKGVVRYFGGRCFDESNCQLRGLFSDAAGAFVAEWVIVDGESYRTVLSDSNDVVRLFMRNIDPPEIE